MQVLRWNDFAGDEEAFHVAGLFSGQMRGVVEHAHDGFVECLWVSSGRLRHGVNGEVSILHAGQFVMLRAADRHDFQSVRGEDFSFRNIAVKDETLAFLGARYFSATPDFWGGVERLPTVWTLTGAALERMERRIARLAEKPRERIYIEQFLLDVLIDSPLCVSSASSLMPDWLERAREGLNDPTEFACGTDALYRLAGRSPEHVSRELKRCTGETPTQLVNRLRLEHAARRLVLSGDEITTLAYDCGFETLSYFSALFKKHFGLTPREYRKKHRTAVFGG